MNKNLNTGLAVLQIILLLVVIYQLNQLQLPTPNAPNAPTAQAPQAAAPSPSPTPIQDINLDDDAMQGSKSAPVTIVEFSDFQCPFCARWHTDTYPQIKKDYIDTGKVKFVYRDYPLPFHAHAQKAAEASECAHTQGKFWEYHGKIMANQASLSPDNLKQWAKDLGLDTKKFNDCLDSGKMASEVQKDMQEGSSYGVSGTPAFFVNGKMISGAQPYANFKQLIDQELS